MIIIEENAAEYPVRSVWLSLQCAFNGEDGSGGMEDLATTFDVGALNLNMKTSGAGQMLISSIPAQTVNDTDGSKHYMTVNADLYQNLYNTGGNLGSSTWLKNALSLTHYAGAYSRLGSSV